jgi:hypothetical protein
MRFSAFAALVLNPPIAALASFTPVETTVILSVVVSMLIISFPM